MSDIKIQQSLNNLQKAVARLKEALAQPHDNPLIIDGTIQRFEFVIELFWKTLKRLLAAEGIEANTPKESFKKAFAAGWLHDETAWLQMLQDRNETSHVYDEEKAQEIYSHVQQNFPELERVFCELSHKMK